VASVLGGLSTPFGGPPIPYGLPSVPGTPRRFDKSYIERVVARGNKRIEVLEERIDGVSSGRVMPDVEEITIGSGRQFDLAVLFLDICGFSARPNWLPEEQKTILRVMNVFMAEMLSIIHDFGGTYEKNTGDGLMAYFGEEEKDASAKVQPAADAALIMHYVNDNLITPWLRSRAIAPVEFRIGIDFGPVTVARVGIHGDKNSRVAIGTTANVANKIMKLIPGGGICIGDKLKELLPHNWGSTCVENGEPSGFVYIADRSPYPTWTLNHRLSPPIF
jgi:class 3 adenylate cyclase